MKIHHGDTEARRRYCQLLTSNRELTSVEFKSTIGNLKLEIPSVPVILIHSN